MDSSNRLPLERLMEMLAGCEGVTPGPYDVWREPVADREAAIAELAYQVNQSEPFAEAVYLLNANGKCPATTGCGPSSERNAAYFARLDPDTVASILTELIALRKAGGVGHDPLGGPFSDADLRKAAIDLLSDHLNFEGMDFMALVNDLVLAFDALQHGRSLSSNQSVESGNG